jgi:hypothetical protein
MDIINNAYLDMNEKGMYEDKYFALSNYDNIYDTTRNNNNNNNNNIDNSNSKLSSEDQDIVDMAKLSSEQQSDNPNIQGNNNSVQPNSNSNQSNF